MRRLRLDHPGSVSERRVPAAARRRLRTKTLAAAAGFVLVLGTGGAAGAESPTAGGELKKKIDKILKAERLDGAASSVVVSDAAGGDVLYEHRPDSRLMPASNTKILTSAAAMELLGPEYRYSTDVLTHGTRRGDRLDGDLYLRGSGDPTLLAKDYKALAADVAASGVKKVSGDLIADDTRFDSQRLGPSWAADDESAYYSSQISALSVAPDTDYDTGSVRLEITPGTAPGKKPKVEAVPSSGYLDIDVKAKTVAEDASETVSVEREHGGNTLTVSGGIPAGADPVKSWTSVWEPTGLAASVFADALRKEGVKVEGRTESGRATPGGARRVARHRSMPLAEIMVPFMKLSNNNHAEVLTKTMGAETGGEGTWEAGLKALHGFLKKKGVDTGSLRQVDGSGLSRMNNVSAGEIHTLLESVRGEPWFKAWHKSLPVACAPDRMTGGTLRSRMCDTPADGKVHAKTGSLTGATALSGYVTDAGGRQLVFSIVLNNFLAESVKDIEDDIVVALASSGGDAATGEGGGSDDSRTPKGAPQQSPGDGPEGLECSWTKPARC